MALALFVSLLVATATAANIDFGTASGTVTAGQTTDLSFISGLAVYKLTVNCDVAATVTFDAYLNATIWANYNSSGVLPLKIGSSLGIGGSAGYILTTSPTTATCTVKITFPTLDATLLAQIIAGVNVGVFKVDATTGGSLRVGTVTVDSSYAVSVTLPQVTGGKAIYLTAAINENWAVSTDIGAKASAWVAAWANQTLQWSCNTAKDLMIEFKAASQTSVTVTPLKNATYNVTIDLKALGVWFKVDLSVVVNHQSTIKYKYTDAQIQAAFGANVDASHLRLAYYDTTQNAWVFPTSGYSVDTQAKVVVQSTDHFSEWGVYMKGANSASGLRISAFTLAGLMLLALAFL